MTITNNAINQIQSHDVVKMTCGGYAMVVIDIRMKDVRCHWHKADGTLEDQSFDSAILQVIPRVEVSIPPTPADNDSKSD